MGAISEKLISWYRANRRELPWRRTSDPYMIWISEVILQQTRVVQGLDYFNRFIARFPDVQTLAAAHQDEILKYWQGLGYYSRARNLHEAARYIVSHFNGKFPVSYKDVLSLKGIGEYTAAAICSIAYKQPFAVIDGNVYRVLSRLFAIDTPIDDTKGKKLFSELAQSLIPIQYPDIYNQAIMEFGALHCLPRNPHCPECPLQENCLAFKMSIVNSLPVKRGKTKIKPRYFNYLHIVRGINTLISQRNQKDIWQNLYEFPLIETNHPVTITELAQTDDFKYLFGDISLQVEAIVAMPKHQLSHRTIYATFYRIEIQEFSPAMQKNYKEIPSANLMQYAVSRLTESYLEQL